MTVRDVYVNHEWVAIATKTDGIYATRLGADITEFLDKEVDTCWVNPVNCEAFITIKE